MKKVRKFFIVLVVVLVVGSTGCGTIPFRVIEVPEGRSPEQQQLDNLECHNMSEVEGPCLYGIGLLAYRQMAKARFKRCMENKGYKVEPE